MLYNTNSCNFLLHLLQIFSSGVFSCRYAILPVCTWVVLVLHVSRKDHLIGNSNFKQFLFFLRLSVPWSRVKGSSQLCPKRYVFKDILQMHFDITQRHIYILWAREGGPRPWHATHSCTPASKFTFHCLSIHKTNFVKQLSKQLVQSQHHSTFRPREQLSPCFVAWLI